MPGPTTPQPGAPNRPPRGPQQPPADLPLAVVNAPYNGLDTVTYDPAELERVRRTGQPSPELLAQARARQQQTAAQRETLRGMTQRVRGGDRALPTPAERGLGRQYSPTEQRAVPPRRSETPGERPMPLLGLGEQPAATPDADPSEQSVQNACAVYPLFWDEADAYGGGIFYAQTFHSCSLIESWRVYHLETSQHLYRCSYYMSAFNICFVPLYYATLYPYCQQWGPIDYSWCGPRVWDPEWHGAGYFIRAWGNITTVEGLFGSVTADSANIAWHCTPEWPDRSCS